jgi:hypothetical protein
MTENTGATFDQTGFIDMYATGTFGLGSARGPRAPFDGLPNGSGDVA